MRGECWKTEIAPSNIERLRALTEMCDVDLGVAYPDEDFLLKIIRWMATHGQATEEMRSTWNVICDAVGVSNER